MRLTHRSLLIVLTIGLFLVERAGVGGIAAAKDMTFAGGNLRKAVCISASNFDSQVAMLFIANQPVTVVLEEYD